MFDLIVQFVSSAGYAGVALLMFAENVFPPIPSELIMPLAGFTAARGDVSFIGVVLAGTAGSVAGVHLWYELGRAVGVERLKRLSATHGRWLTLLPQEVDAATHWFERHGAAAVMFGRLVPTVRTLISVPAGVARMGRLRFIAYSTLGTLVWTGLLAGLGFALESRYEQVAEWLNPIATTIVVVLVALYLWRFATFDRRLQAASNES